MPLFPMLDSGWKRRFQTLISLLATAVIPFQGAAGIRINEFAAENDGGLADSDGDTPDWIELYNDSGNSVNLAGWRLTDATTNLSRWVFPSTNLAGYGFMVVFASGKNRTVPGAELHTNFQLENGGGYLALVRPEGTVESEFAPAYPPQRRTATFGTGATRPAFTLISATHAGKYLVPNSGTGSSWKNRTYNDSSWTSVTNGFGFDTWQSHSTNLSVLLALDINDRTNTVTQSGFSSFLINSNTSATAAQTSPTHRTFGGLGVTLSSTTSNSYDDRVRSTPGNSGPFTDSSLLRDHVFCTDFTGTGGISLVITGLPPGQVFSATIWSFDTGSTGYRIADWYANGEMVRDNYKFDGSVLPWYNEDYQFSFETMTTPGGSLAIMSKRDLATTNGPAGQFNALRLTRTGYRALLASDLQAPVSGVNASVYTRFPFALATVAPHTNLLLRARYDDGFAAYLNGTLVASRNAPASPIWNSAATNVHPASSWEEIPLAIPGGLLVAGNNVLAVHLMNIAATNTAMLGQFELLSMTGDEAGRFLSPATPGATNGLGYLGFVADTKFSVNRGYQETPFSLSITSATVGASIYWTTNGTVPGPTNGLLFTAPLWISQNTWVRARAFAPDLVPTEPETHTYLFIPQVLQQADLQPGYPTAWQANYPADYGMDPTVVNHPVYSQSLSNDLRSLPVLSLTGPHDDFWGPYGIYRDATRTDPRYERAATVELFDPNNGTLFAVNCGVEMHGNASRDNLRTPKHSFRLSFKSQYGPSKLHYDWFGGGVTEFDTVVLRGLGFGDCWSTRYSDTSAVPNTAYIGLRYRPENSTYLKDHWVKESYRAMGHFGTRSDYVHLFLNGLYWGLVNPSERIDAESMTEHFGGREMDWDVMAGDETYNLAEVRDGNKIDWNALMAMVNAGITNQQSYELVLTQIDEVGLVDFMMVHGFMEAEDWPFHNWYAAHRRATNGQPATEWIFLPWDQEIGMDRFVRRDKVNVDSADTPSRIYARLRAWPEFRVLYADRVQKHFFNDGVLTFSNSVARFELLAARIHDAMVPESARWGDAREVPITTSNGSNPGTGVTFTRDEWWRPELLALYSNWFAVVGQEFIARLRATNLFPVLGAPDFAQFGGGVPAGYHLAVSHTNAVGSIFYTVDGSDPRQDGTGGIRPEAIAYSGPVPILGPTVVRARVYDAGTWSAIVEAPFYPPQDLSRLALTEIMFHPPGLGITNSDEFEFIELKNTGTNTLNLSGLTFTAGIAFTFTNGTELAPGQFAVLVRNAGVFSSRYPGVAVAGVFGGRLDNGGETITLSHATGGRLFSVTYDDLAPWPMTPDGFGFSLVQPAHSTSPAPETPNKWRASTHPLGSPAADDPVPGLPPVVINEVLTHTDPPLEDTIELHNPTETNALIGGWFLTDNPAAPTLYRIPDGMAIPPGGYVVFTATQIGSFLLSELGEAVYLFSGDAATNMTGYSHGFSFQAADNGIAFGRHLNSAGEETFPSQLSRTLGTNNAGPLIPPVIITEIHYNPLLGGDEFIEIQNTSSSGVPLYHPLSPTNCWRIAGVDFSFPGGTILQSGQYAVIVATNPVSFRDKYQVPAGSLVLGPWSGTLQDSGERIQAERPADPDPMGPGWVVVDSIRYNDKSPWPPAADGTGASLHRVQSMAYGDEPLNWRASAPTPGMPAPSLDSDNDGMPDDWEDANGLDRLANDAEQDGDMDGFSNYEEYVAGTDPQSALSRLQIEDVTQVGGTVELRFTAVAGRSYTVLYRNGAGSGGWGVLEQVAAPAVTQSVKVTDSTATSLSRFYRLVTPAVP